MCIRDRARALIQQMRQEDADIIRERFHSNQQGGLPGQQREKDGASGGVDDKVREDPNGKQKPRARGWTGKAGSATSGSS